MTRRVVSIPHTSEHLNLAGGNFSSAGGGTHSLAFDEYVEMVRGFGHMTLDYEKKERK